MFNLSQLSVWWLRLAISIERIKPGHPQQNGAHERTHLLLQRNNLSRSLAGQAVGVKVESGIWLVSFMDYDLGYIDLE